MLISLGCMLVIVVQEDTDHLFASIAELKTNAVLAPIQVRISAIHVTPMTNFI